MYTCFNCKIQKPISEFHKDVSRLLGFKETCKQCLSSKRKSKPKKEYSISVTNFTCIVCKNNKNFKLFDLNKRKKTGIHDVCKECRKIRSKRQYEKHKDKIKEKCNSYYYENKNEIRKKRKIYQTTRLKNDSNFKLVRNLRNRLYYALKNKKWKKHTQFGEYIGCTREELLIHIEKQFKDGMSWENIGKWEIDHVKPLSKALNEEDLYKRCHYTNLRPLWKIDNVKKGNKEICWQKIKRDQHLDEDGKLFPLNLEVKNFIFSKEEYKIEHRKFIEKYEWLGNIGFNIQWVFTARWDGNLAGVVMLSEARKAQFGEKEAVIQRGACSSWAPKNLNSSLIMFACRWMVQNTNKRYFIGYIDREAGEIGTIYQACNFKFLGFKFGVRRKYILPNGEKWDRSSFFRQAYLKIVAKDFGIKWEGDIEDSIKEAIKSKVRQILKKLPKIDVPRKGKYVLVLNKDKERNIMDKETFPYPKRN